MGQTLKIEVIDSLKGMAEMGKSWNHLLMASRASTIFLTWEWLFTWTEYFAKEDRTPFVLAVYKGRELVGVAPWCIRQSGFGLSRPRQIEFLGTSGAGSDYLDVFAKRGKEREVSSCIYEFLFDEAASCWDRLYLQDIPSSSLFLLYLLDKIDEKGQYARIDLGAFSPVAILPASTEEFMAGLSPNRREQFMRHWRLLHRRGEVRHVSVNPSEGVNNEGLQEFLSLFQNRRMGNQESFFEFLKMFTFRCSSQNWIQMDFLKVDQRTIAGLFHLCFQGTRFMYLAAVDRAYYPQISIGNLLLGCCIREAVRSGVQVYDFLKGSEAYKFHWANHGKRSINLCLWRKSFKNLLPLTLHSLRDIAKWLVR